MNATESSITNLRLFNPILNSNQSPNSGLIIKGVTNVYYNNGCIIVDFASKPAMDKAIETTGWKTFSDLSLMMTVKNNIPEHPIIMCNYKSEEYIFSKWEIIPAKSIDQAKNESAKRKDSFSFTGFFLYVVSHIGGSAVKKMKRHLIKGYQTFSGYLRLREKEYRSYLQKKKDQ